MAILNFTLTTEAIGKLHDALVCLGKFSEAVSIEASHDKVCAAKYVVEFSDFPIACFDCSEFIKVRVLFIYFGWEQVLLQISLQSSETEDPGEREVQL